MPLHPLHRYIFPWFFREVIWIQSFTAIIQLQKKALIDPLQPATTRYKIITNSLELINSSNTTLRDVPVAGHFDFDSSLQDYAVLKPYCSSLSSWRAKYFFRDIIDTFIENIGVRCFLPRLKGHLPRLKPDLPRLNCRLPRLKSGWRRPGSIQPSALGIQPTKLLLAAGLLAGPAHPSRNAKEHTTGKRLEEGPRDSGIRSFPFGGPQGQDFGSLPFGSLSSP